MGGKIPCTIPQETGGGFRLKKLNRPEKGLRFLTRPDAGMLLPQDLLLPGKRQAILESTQKLFQNTLRGGYGQPIGQLSLTLYRCVRVESGKVFLSFTKLVDEFPRRRLFSLQAPAESLSSNIFSHFFSALDASVVGCFFWVDEDFVFPASRRRVFVGILQTSSGPKYWMAPG